MAASVSEVTKVSKKLFGTTERGIDVDAYTLSNDAIAVTIITYGARVTAIETADRDGARANVVLGYADLHTYEHDKSYFGATVGRFANRIAKGQFTVAGKTFQAPINNPPNSLHGGADSFAQRLWSAAVVDDGVAMELVSPDGDQGYPGTLTVRAVYTLRGVQLQCEIFATTDRETVVNLTNHAYFNLSGEGSGTVLHDVVQIHADRYVPVDGTQIPTGELADVADTPFDFRSEHVVGARIDADDAQLRGAGGYDHTYVLNGEAGTLREAARVFDPASGRTLTVETTQPGVQFYTGNSLTGTAIASNGKVIERRGGLCLETQHLPDSPNRPQFPSTVLKPGETFHEVTVFTFGTA